MDLSNFRIKYRKQERIDAPAVKQWRSGATTSTQQQHIQTTGEKQHSNRLEMCVLNASRAYFGCVYQSRIDYTVVYMGEDILIRMRGIP
jgi:hypothetical protein